VDIGSAYVEVQDRLIAVVEDPATDLRAPVPACPGWSVRDVFSHHVGVVADVARGDFGEFQDRVADLLEQWRDVEVQRARDAMTARQVDERGRVEVAALVAEWRRATVEVLAMLTGEVAVPDSLPPFMGFVLINDVVVHETDIRAALGLPRAQESAALSIALAAYSFSLESRIRNLGLPALVLTYDGKERRIGEGEAGASLAADRHELVRVLAGRRSREQIRNLVWTGDPAPYVDVLSEYGPTDVAGLD
jgi:uncharacterized protein (TIGR03083 family)